MKKVLFGIATFITTAVLCVVSAGAELVVPESLADGTTASTGSWYVNLYDEGLDTEGRIPIDYDIDYTSVSAIRFTIDTDENNFDSFAGDIGGGVVFSCNGGDVLADSEANETYNWKISEWWGVYDETYDIDTADKSKNYFEAAGYATYQITVEVTNPLSCDTDDWEINKIDRMTVGIMEWGVEPYPIEVTKCEILDKRDNVLVWFDGSGNPSRENVAADNENEIGNYTYEVLDDNTIEITGYTGTRENLKIPSEIDGKKVTSIGESAFDNNGTITSVTIPEGVTTIKEYAFCDCDYLSRIVVPDTVNYIGSYAFSYTSIEDFHIPYGVTSIESSTFNGCHYLTSVEIPDSVIYIDYSAFRYCSSLETIIIPDSVKKIRASAFEDCSSLSTINLPQNLKSIGIDAFDNTALLNSQTSDVKYIGTWAVDYDETATNIVIKEGTTNMANELFYNCTSLKTVVIHDGITSINDFAFACCSSLESIYIPDSVTSIGYMAFLECTSLTEITNATNVSFIDINAVPDTFLSNIEANETIYIGKYLMKCGTAVKSVSVREGTLAIWKNAFEDCTSLKSVTIPDSVTEIQQYAFDGCTSLETINLPPSLKQISYNTFYGCESLKKIVIPDKVTGIGMRAFYGCSALESVTIPEGVRVIGKSAFYNCTLLNNIAIPDSVISVGSSAFGDTAILNSQTAKGLKYVSNWVVGYDGWSLYSEDFKEGTVGIADEVFGNYGYHYSYIEIPEGVKYIGEKAFYNCEPLESVVVPDSVISIGIDAFYNTSFYNNITDEVKYIGKCIVECPKDITSITLKNDTKGVGGGAFGSCTLLTSIELPDTVVNIDNSAFSACTKLSQIDLPENLLYIGANSFWCCYALTDVTIPKNVAYIGEGALGYKSTKGGVSNKIEDLVISCYKGSTAEQYAIDNRVEYSIIAAPPTNFSNFSVKSCNYNSITLSWDKNASATGYIIQQMKNNAWVNIANIKDNATTSYKISGLAANTSYKFRAVAYVTDGESTAYSSYTSALTVTTAPAQTTGFAITGRGSDFLTISWTKNAGASGYIIQEQIDGVWTKVVAIKGNTTTSYKITGLLPNSFHRYRMVAYKTDTNGTCYGKYTGSAPGYTAPAMVSGFKVSEIGADSLTVSWSKVTSANGYVIDIYKDGKWSQLAKITSNATTSYKATGLNIGTTYKFRIKSYATNGTLTINSTYSSAVSGVPALSKIENLRMTNRGTDFISVRWDKDEKADGYMVYLYDGTSWKCVKTMATNSAVSHKITGLESGKTYKITVKAIKTVDDVKYISDPVTISATTL